MSTEKLALRASLALVAAAAAARWAMRDGTWLARVLDGMCPCGDCRG